MVLPTVPHGTQIVFRIIYAVLIVVNVAGNVLVCLAVRRFSFMRSTMNYLIVHVAICDILSGIFFTPRAVLIGLYEHPSGRLGDFLCKFILFGKFGWMAGCASLYTLLAIAWERYKAIVRPHSPRFSNKQVKQAVVISWLIGFIVGLPEIVVTKYHSIDICKLDWMGKWDDVFNATLWLIGAGLVPSLVMIILYVKVISILWCGGNRIEDVSQRSLMKSRKKVTKSVILVTITLFVCWLPILVTIVISSYSSNHNLPKKEPEFYQFAWTLFLLNSTVNPFIYALQDTRFRKCMKQILWRNESDETSNDAPENIPN